MSFEVEKTVDGFHLSFVSRHLSFVFLCELHYQHY